MILIDKFLLTDEEQVELVLEIVKYCKELSTCYKKFCIYLTFSEDFNKDIYDPSNDWSVKDYYTTFYNYLNLCLAASLEQIKHSFSSPTHYNSNEIMDTLVIYGSSVFYIHTLIKNHLFVKTQTKDNINKLYFKLHHQFKIEFYKFFEEYTSQFLNENSKEYLLVPKYEREIKMYSFLVKDCCERLNELKFDEFLV
jgi:hypothetical protein